MAMMFMLQPTFFVVGSADDKKKLAEIVCTNRLPPFTTTGNEMFVEYKDFWASNGLGFNISYVFGKYSTSDTEVIQLPNG